jgi:hypothetical protein
MYVDEATAENALRRVWEACHSGHAQGLGHMPHRIYLCPTCGWWHLTTSLHNP